MRIFVDADAFPNAFKDILLKAVLKNSIETIFVANKNITIPKNQNVKIHIAPFGANEADNYIVDNCNGDDLIITADIPLADRVIDKDSLVLNLNGTFLNKENIKDILVNRNLMQELRDAGVITKGPNAISEKEVRNFANGLNQFLTKYFKNKHK